jgi:predicted transposase YbfD/YdcC
VTRVFECPKEIAEGWTGLVSFIEVSRSVLYKNNKATKETAYFISSLPAAATSAAKFSGGIRGHWKIENSDHYVKDVTMKEDASKTKTGKAPQNISLIKNIALNLFRQNGYQNTAQAIRLVANDVPKLWEMVSA